MDRGALAAPHARRAALTEAEARVALAAFDGIGGLERWIAQQRPWQAIPTGWMVPGKLQGLALPGGARARRGAGGRARRWRAGGVVRAGAVAQAVRAFLYRRGRA